MSAYPESMQASILKMESTRPTRAKEEFPRLTLAERQDLLQKYHPDYREGGRREVKVGVNRGQRVPHELADLFEGVSFARPGEIDLARVRREVDVLVIGGEEAAFPGRFLRPNSERRH
jgi:hypothetical protein